MKGDFRSIIVKAKREVFDKSAIGVYINETKNMALNFNFILFQHADRDANSVAHTIASMDFNLQNSFYWVEEVPPEAVESVESDRKLLQQYERN